MAFGSGGGVFGSIREIFANDALITKSGDIVKFHTDDNIIAEEGFIMMIHFSINEKSKSQPN